VRRALLSADSITKSYAGIRALEDVSFEVRAHEVHALVGENGAGKSTLIKVLAGVERPDGGTVSMGGRVASGLDPARARALGVAVVHQQPALFPHLSVAENLALGYEQLRPWQRIDWAARSMRARHLLSRVGGRIEPERLVLSLSMAEQQIVEIARALGAAARILILDEPTASLTSNEADLLLEVVRRLREEGVGIVYVSHRLDEVLAIADRVTVLRDGRLAGTEPARGLSPAALVRLMVGNELHDPGVREPYPGAEAVLEVRRLSNRAAGVHDVSLSVGRGEILGLAGLVGSGRTQLAETIFGISPADAGTIHVAGALVPVRGPHDAVRAAVAYVPEDRRRHGVILGLSVAANSTLASLGAVAVRGLIDGQAEKEAGRAAIAAFHIKASSPDAEVATLSGGNQQKVALARWLATSPKVLILDEPTQGIDIGSKGEIHRLVQELADRGLAVLLISSDLEELLLLSDRVAVMRGGRVAGVLSREAATRHAVLGLALTASAGPVEGPHAAA
jgi:rhamnose transport system ATP-binding protein